MKQEPKRKVLVAVLKGKEDLPLLLEGKWYRIPMASLPKRTFTHVAFYQPACFGKDGKRIVYYARALKREIRKRVELLPEEHRHPAAESDYLKMSFERIEKLEHPIRNIVPRRVSFGFTDLKTLRSAKDILELYHVPPTEQIIEQELRMLGIPFTSQYRVSSSPHQLRRGADRVPPKPLAKGESARRGGGVKKYRLDLAIFCKDGQVAIECDNDKAHGGKLQKAKDKEKDAFLQKLGWRVVRLSEEAIMERLERSVRRIERTVRMLGGCG